jgi:hypothetical protein
VNSDGCRGMFPPWYSCDKLFDIGRRVHLNLIIRDGKSTISFTIYATISTRLSPTATASCLDTRELSDRHSVDLYSVIGHLIQVIDMPELPGM